MFLILLQVLIVQHIQLGTYIILLPYTLVIILLPFETPKMLLLLTSFILGVIIDFFFDSSGLHASACTIMGFSRYYVLKFISPREGYDAGVQPCVEDMGLAWFLSYAGTLIFIHHLFFFYMEVFRFSEFFRILLRVILSTIGTFGLIYMIQFLFYYKRRRS
ncbi:MAG: rod shape-determining protein MreD [Bacteroidetes bacterium]|nr:rod shape-determining protein MreD [Bacteroidota bacterium]